VRVSAGLSLRLNMRLLLSMRRAPVRLGVGIVDAQVMIGAARHGTEFWSGGVGIG